MTKRDLVIRIARGTIYCLGSYRFHGLLKSPQLPQGRSLALSAPACFICWERRLGSDRGRVLGERFCVGGCR